jgi:hypothetical protein
MHAPEKKRDDRRNILVLFVHANIDQVAIFTASTPYHGAAGS